jgi:alpha-tubulin suppressor-like RCC1 family protein
LSGIADVALGVGFSCVRLNDATLRCWGYNRYNEVGNGSTSDAHSPVAVAGVSAAVELSAGDYHACATLNNGSISCWGRNLESQLGDGTYASRLTPVAAQGLPAAATAAVAGYSATCAVLTDNTAYCWGANGAGQLGNGQTVDSSTPTLVLNVP